MKLNLNQCQGTIDELNINRRLFDSGTKKAPQVEEYALLLDGSLKDDSALNISGCSLKDSFEEEEAVYSLTTMEKIARLGPLSNQLAADVQAIQSKRSVLSKEIENIYTTIESLSSAYLLRKREDLLTF